MKYSNNPFNIRATHSQWFGLTGKVNGFCTFDSVAYSVRVFLYLVLKTYKKRKSNYTLRDFVHFYCPNGDGNNNESVYLGFLVNELKFCDKFVTPDFSPLNFSRFMLFVLAKSVCKMESNYSLKYRVFLDGYSLFRKLYYE